MLIVVLEGTMQWNERRDPSRCFVWFGTQKIASLGMLTLVAGCTFTVDRPPLSGTERRSLSYERAVDYLNTARNNLSVKLADVDRFDNASKGLVAVGVGGAAIATV